MLKRPPAVVTLGEVATIVSRLERRRYSSAQVRSILILNTSGRPFTPRRRGETRSYTALDVALVRLTLRLRAEGVSPIVARVVVEGLREQLAVVWQNGDPLALAVRGLRGLVLYGKQRPAHVAAWVPLRDVWNGIERAIQVTRADKPEVWQWASRSAVSMIEKGRGDVRHAQ